MTTMQHVTQDSRRAERLRGWADTMTRLAEDKEAPRQENTRKRRMEAMSRRCDALDLRRAARACRALAAAVSEGEAPEELRKLTKGKIQAMTSCRRDISSAGVLPTEEPHDTSADARALRELADAYGDPDDDAPTADDARLAAELARVTAQGIPGFFPTPPDLAAEMVTLAGVQAGRTTLEPSAGRGDICQAIADAGGIVHALEIAPPLADLIERRAAAEGWAGTVECCDFLDWTGPEEGFHAIVMNPPFERAQDAAHVMHAAAQLRDGGVLVALVSPGLFFRQTRKEQAFREWFESAGGERIRDIEPGTFPTAGAGAVLIRVTAD